MVEMMKNGSVLVTGSTGLIGRAVVALLQAERRRVVTLGRAANCDYRMNLSQEGLQLAEKIPRPDFVVHLAAPVPSGEGRSDSIPAYEVTRLIDQNILDACKKWACPVIYTSGCSLYLNKGNKTLNETDELNKELLSPYLQAKAAGDTDFRAYEQGTVLRISCPIGPGISGLSVVGRFLDQLKKNGVINIYGSGTREQDFIDVRDIAESINLVMVHNIQGVFNIASGVPTTMRCLANLIVEVYGGSGQILTGHCKDPQEGFTARYSIARANESLSWYPRRSLKESMNWIKRYKL